MPEAMDRGASAPRLLAMDTSADALVLALVQGDVVHAHEEAGGPLASARLLPALDAMLSQAGWALDSIDAVAYAQGPGAFTGLRTAVSVAQGLALGMNCPTLGIDSLMIVADAAREQTADEQSESQGDGASLDAHRRPLRVRVLMDARMDEVYDGVFDWHVPANSWSVVEPASLRSPAAVAASWSSLQPGVDLVAGSALSAMGDRLGVPPALRTQGTASGRAHALARLARQAWREGRQRDAAQAQPVYVRDKVALTTAERMAGAAHNAASTPKAPS